MDTIYYTLNTRRVKVSGGADLVRFVPLARPQAGEQEKRAGEILDLELCKKRLETKNAWKELYRAVDEFPEPTAEEDEAPTPAPVLARREVPTWLELGATAAVLLAGLSAAAAFLSVL